MEHDEDFFSLSLCRRMEKYTNLDGPMHPYDKNMGQCHVWEGHKIHNGYGRIRAVSKGGKSRMLLAHRASLVCALTPAFPSEVARHTCDNRACVNPAHILPSSKWENITDREARDRNIVKKGEEHHRAKLTYQDIEDIKKDPRSCLKISKSYNLSSTTIQAIKNGETWKTSQKTKAYKKPSYGIDHYMAKLNPEKVREIRNSKEPLWELAKKYSVSYSTVKDVADGKTWKQVK